MKQDESGSDEAAVEGDDTKYGLGEWVNSRKLSTRRLQKACKKTSAPAQGKVGDDKDVLSFRELSLATSAVVPTVTLTQSLAIQRRTSG